jgi:hypothetical protein
MKTSNIGAPLMFSQREQTQSPKSQSSRTGTKKEGVLRKLFKDLTSSLLISTPVGAMKKENVPDVTKPNELFALRGTVRQPVSQSPSNIMAGAPPPKPLSGAPPPPGGNAPAPSIGRMGSAAGPMSAGGAAGPMSAGGAAGPMSAGVLPTPGRPLPGVPAGSRVKCTKDKCEFTTAPASTIQGIISMTIPVDTANHPVLSKIRNVSFIPGNAAATLGVPIKKNEPIKVKPPLAQPIGAKPPPPSTKVNAPPPQIFKTKGPLFRIFRRNRPNSSKPIGLIGKNQRPVNTYVKHGTFGRTRTVQVYPNGSKVIIVRNKQGQIIRVIRR